MASEDREWREYSQRFRREVLPGILGSDTFLSMGSETGDFDVRQATEIGAALLCDKPFVLLIPKGRHVSSRLRAAADVVLEDFDVNDAASQERLADAINRAGE